MVMRHHFYSNWKQTYSAATAGQRSINWWPTLCCLPGDLLNALICILLGHRPGSQPHRAIGQGLTSSPLFQMWSCCH